MRFLRRSGEAKLPNQRTGAPRPGSRGRERGVVLLSALLSVALLTLIVVEMTDTTLVASHLTRNAGNAIAAQLLARSAEVAAEGLLVQLRREDGTKTFQGQLWAIPFPDVPVGDGAAAFAIEDERGKLDLNQVEDPLQRPVLERLFAELGLEPSLLESVAIWTRRDPAGGAMPEARAECALTIPCDPPGGPLRSVDELALIRGFDPVTIERLRPFVTAVAGGTKWLGANVNTARPEVMRALGCEVGQDWSPPLEGFPSKPDVEECEGVDPKLVHLESDLFSIQARGTVGDTTENLYVIVDRSSSPPKRLLWKERPVFAAAPIGVR